MLTASQRRRLRHLATSADAAPYLSRRAGWVLEAADGNTDRTATRWLRRYLDRGLPGLEDARRSGRPSRLTDDAVRRVLMEPLFVPSAKWTSRTVADAAGLSQATVVRLWARAFAPETLADAAPWRRLDHSCRPTGLLLGGGGAVIVLERIATGRPHRGANHRTGAENGAMRSPLRPLLQTVLAGELIDLDGTPPPSVPEFLSAAMPSRASTYVVLCAAADGDVDSALKQLSAGVEVVRVPAVHWQALLPHLTAALTPGARPALETLAHRVREWAATTPDSPHQGLSIRAAMRTTAARPAGSSASR